MFPSISSSIAKLNGAWPDSPPGSATGRRVENCPRCIKYRPKGRFAGDARSFIGVFTVLSALSRQYIYNVSAPNTDSCCRGLHVQTQARSWKILFFLDFLGSIDVLHI